MRGAGKACLIGLLVMLSANRAGADEWNLSGAVNQGVEYDDNINMSSDAAAVFGYLLRPSLLANWSTARSEIAVNGRADLRRYDDRRWDCDNFTLGMEQHYIGKRHDFLLPFEYAQNCSYSRQDADTGVLVPNSTSERYDISPSWSWDWSARSKLTFGASYNQTLYTNGAGGNIGAGSANFSDNRSYSLNVSEQYLWTRRLSSTLSLFAARSEFDNAQRSTSQNVYGFQLAGQYAISRMWSVSGGLGLRWVQLPAALTGSAGDSLQRTEVANLALDYTGRRSNFVADFSRTVSPSAFGQVFEYNAFSISYRRNIDRALAFNLRASFQQNEAVGQSQISASQQRRYYSLSPQLSWNFARDWQLTASYRYRLQQYSSDGGSAALSGTRDSNAIMLHVNYDWDGLRVSGSRPVD